MNFQAQAGEGGMNLIGFGVKGTKFFLLSCRAQNNLSSSLTVISCLGWFASRGKAPGTTAIPRTSEYLRTYYKEGAYYPQTKGWIGGNL